MLNFWRELKSTRSPGRLFRSATTRSEKRFDRFLYVLCRLFGGLIQDVKLKAKWYVSDYKDGLHVQCVAAFFFMYFACLTPIVTFGGLLGAATDNYIVR